MAAFIDGFDLYQAANGAIAASKFNAKWGASAATDNGAITARSGRYSGSKGIELTGDGTSSTSLALPFAQSSATHMYVAFNVCKRASNGSDSSLDIVVSGSPTVSIEYVSISDELQVTISGTTEVLTGVDGTWKTIEIDYDYTSSPVVKLYVNGTLITTKTGSSWAGTLTLSTMEATSTIVIDDFAAFRDNDSGLNALLGRNWAIETLIPNADQSGGTWTPSTGSDKFDVVDDVPPNDSTYIQALDVGDIQLFDLPNLANLTAAKVVTLTGRLRDVGGTGNQPQFQIGNAGTATNAGSAITMAGSGFEDHFLLLATDPRDSGAWDVTKVNNLQAGVKVAS